MSVESQAEETAITQEMLAQNKQAVIARDRHHLAALDRELTDDELSSSLPHAATVAFHLENFDTAKSLAERSLVFAAQRNPNWNTGNAIHLGHTVLGLLAVREGAVDVAMNELKLSAETVGSPQLNSFGPTMQLAKELLIIGNTTTVLEYLRQCRSFWKSGSAWLDIWEEKIRVGKIPNFFFHAFC